MPSPTIVSAKLTARRKARVVMNRQALDEAQLGMADALAAIGERIIADARETAPKDPVAAAARGVPMMRDTGNFVVYANGKKVAGDVGGTGKPRGMNTPAGQAVLGVWFSSHLAHLLELGTVKMTARPFLLPAVNRQIRGAGPYVERAMAARMASAPWRAQVGVAMKAGDTEALRIAQKAVRTTEAKVRGRGVL
jgi:hypothetical protein